MGRDRTDSYRHAVNGNGYGGPHEGRLLEEVQMTGGVIMV